MLRDALVTPWKIRNIIKSTLIYPWVRLLFAVNCIPWEKGWRFYGAPIIQKHRKSHMSFGPCLQLRSTLRSNPLAPDHPVVLATLRQDASIRTGAGFGMTGGAICAAKGIFIGDNVVVGANTIIMDTDFHPIDLARRKTKPNDGECSEVIIEDDVFIGMGCLILKGVIIGNSSVIGAGSIVSTDIPPMVVAAGNPARVLKNLDVKGMKVKSSNPIHYLLNTPRRGNPA
jgi:acetyltransferase-like isoleucine patch superfamily enzyme